MRKRPGYTVAVAAALLGVRFGVPTALAQDAVAPSPSGIAPPPRAEVAQETPL